MRRIGFFFFLAAAAAPLMLAQSVPAGQTEIKGSENPELIPERDAYWMLFMHMADGPRAMSRRARILFLQPSGLTEAQMDAVIDAATEYMAASNAIREQFKRFLSANPERPMPAAVRAEYEFVAARELAAFEAAFQRLRSNLDAEGRWRLKKFVNTAVKATMIMTKPQ
jgi:hypothetical protein